MACYTIMPSAKSTAPKTPAKAAKAPKAAAKTTGKAAAKTTGKAAKAKVTKAAKVAAPAPPQNTVVAAAPDLTPDPAVVVLEALTAAFAAAHQRSQQLSAAALLP